MIGGLDMDLPGFSSPEDVSLVFRVARLFWPDGLARASGSEVLVPLRRATRCCWPREFFIYRSEAACRSWREHGLTDDNADTMIYCIILDDGITLVVEGEGSVSYGIARQIFGVLTEHRHAVSGRSRGTPRLAA